MAGLTVMCNHTSGFSGCPNQEVGWPFLFNGLLIGTCSTFVPIWPPNKRTICTFVLAHSVGIHRVRECQNICVRPFVFGKLWIFVIEKFKMQAKTFYKSSYCTVFYVGYQCRDHHYLSARLEGCTRRFDALENDFLPFSFALVLQDSAIYSRPRTVFRMRHILPNGANTDCALLFQVVLPILLYFIFTLYWLYIVLYAMVWRTALLHYCVHHCIVHSCSVHICDAQFNLHTSNTL
jgi:hypothetical protein